MKTGSVMSACQIFENLSMKEECVECLAYAGILSKAMEMAEQLMKIEETPKVLCIYGELKKDISFFKKAW